MVYRLPTVTLVQTVSIVSLLPRLSASRFPLSLKTNEPLPLHSPEQCNPSIPLLQPRLLFPTAFLSLFPANRQMFSSKSCSSSQRFVPAPPVLMCHTLVVLYPGFFALTITHENAQSYSAMSSSPLIGLKSQWPRRPVVSGKAMMSITIEPEQLARSDTTVPTFPRHFKLLACFLPGVIDL